MTNQLAPTIEDAIQLAAQAHIAIRVKIVDLEDNMNIHRSSELTEEDSERLQKESH